MLKTLRRYWYRRNIYCKEITAKVVNPAIHQITYTIFEPIYPKYTGNKAKIEVAMESQPLLVQKGNNGGHNRESKKGKRKRVYTFPRGSYSI